MNDQTTIALVTGGSRGLGRSTVEALASRGVSSIFTYKENDVEAKKVVERVKAIGVTSLSLIHI